MLRQFDSKYYLKTGMIGVRLEKSRIFADKSRKIARQSTRLSSRRNPTHTLPSAVATTTPPSTASRWIGSCTLCGHLQLSKLYWLRHRTAPLRNTDPLTGTQPIINHQLRASLIPHPLRRYFTCKLEIISSGQSLYVP